MSRAAKNKLQNFLIVLLSVTAVLLFLQNRRLTHGDGGLLSRLFADPGTAIADSAGPAEIAALPLRFAASGDYAAYGSLGMTPQDSGSAPFLSAQALYAQASYWKNTQVYSVCRQGCRPDQI